jgi:hypothetical protein
MKKTKNPKVGSLVYDKDQEDWGIILKFKKKKNTIIYTVQFVDDPSPIVLHDIHDSDFQECYN